MERILAILEVSRKQDYIFASTKLRENAARSKEISDATGSDFLKKAADGLYDEAENLVYSGGGHTVLQFYDREQAKEVIWRVTKAAMETYAGMELFAKLLPYKENLTPGENLHKLTAALEKKKALRRSSVRFAAQSSTVWRSVTRRGLSRTGPRSCGAFGLPTRFRRWQRARCCRLSWAFMRIRTRRAA